MVWWYIDTGNTCFIDLRGDIVARNKKGQETSNGALDRVFLYLASFKGQTMGNCLKQQLYPSLMKGIDNMEYYEINDTFKKEDYERFIQFFRLLIEDNNNINDNNFNEWETRKKNIKLYNHIIDILTKEMEQMKE